jgi:tetratricopeptide (TPR) repeat protein
MTATISGTKVATPGDLQVLEKKLDRLAELVNQVNRNARTRSEENASEIRILQSDLKAQAARADKLEAGIEDLRTTLRSIGEEVNRSSGLLDKVNDHLTKSSSVLNEITTSVQEQTQTEVARRQEMTEGLEQLLHQYKAQATTLQQAFADIRSNLIELTQAEQAGAKSVETSLRRLHEALVLLQSRVQEDLTRANEAVRDFTHAKGERAHQEATVFGELLGIQQHLQERLEAIEIAADGLSASSIKAQESQQARLTQTMTWRAQELSHQASLLLHRGDYPAAILLLEEASQLAPEDIVIQANLALAYFKTEPSQYELARDLLGQILEQDPQAVAALNGLGVVCLDQLDPEAALLHLQRAAQLAPDDAIIWLNLGKAHYGCGAIGPALDAWQRARQLQPTLVADDAAVRILLEEREFLRSVQSKEVHSEV